MFKIATWNVNSLRVRLEHVLNWLAEQQPDVLALQEIKMQDPDFPMDAIRDAGYHAVFSGQKTYNGVAILSKNPPDDPNDIQTDIPDLDDPQRRVLGATYSGIHVLNLYVPNGSEVDSEKYHYKLNWLAKLAAYSTSLSEKHPKLILLGDFNIAPDDRDVHDPKAWEGKVLVSPPERDALQKLLDLGLQDTFRLFEQDEKLYSWWDYRMLGFRRNHGLRIDLLLASEALAAQCKKGYIDKKPRKLERPSDHTPAVAEFEI